MMRRWCWLSSKISPPSEAYNYSYSYSKEHHLIWLIQSCITMRHLEQLHARIIRTGFDQHIFVLAKLLTFCADSDHHIATDHALSLFNHIQHPDTFIWNTVIRALAKARRTQDAFLLFRTMRRSGNSPDNFTFAFLLKLCGDLPTAAMGAQLHGSVLTHGFQTHSFVRNTLVHMYGLFGDMSNAYQVFEEIPGADADIVLWNSLIDGHVHCGHYREALRVFERMQRSGFTPDDATIVVTLSACSELGELDYGKRIHARLSRSMLRDFVSVSNALIDMYAKCGEIDRAVDVFEGMKERSVISWNSMILGLAMHGRAGQALVLFDRMRGQASPDGITFLGVLCACAHGGLVEEGKYYFESMTKDYGIKPMVQHYGCLVDLFGRMGFLREGYDLINGMQVKGNAVVWRALLAACRVHGEVELGELVQRNLQELEEHSSDYVLLSHVYAGAGQWNQVFRLRGMMHGRGVKKPGPGNSLIREHMF
ncbi:pentatricopeptide repeat-containing protein At1g59720, chloroplastic/mitochondrial-like [Dioscorea cayenensis subsp. rotundata]|uniref:Pentatricopeptide repeat-containing protein At1g59720, chloroplastic/mitochondrial-like n=1 Tax=Dioscorea cayennensis subsp. rotundata TaxID=55577 RepID=A0AB40B8P1_DIOCR|nr:pentatricopeptide repeat-containing protein At1g59720, chloroplastic/mitochondrial-like [Dioscorea cayenensis subsp. rotundata]